MKSRVRPDTAIVIGAGVEARCDCRLHPRWMQIEPEDHRETGQKIALCADDGAAGET
jgi:hypothetical protein